MAEQIDIISQNTQSTVIAEFERQDKERALSDHFVIKKIPSDFRKIPEICKFRGRIIR